MGSGHAAACRVYRLKRVAFMGLVQTMVTRNSCACRVGQAGRWHPLLHIFRTQLAVRRVLGALTGGAVRPSAASLTQETCMPFSQVHCRPGQVLHRCHAC